MRGIVRFFACVAVLLFLVGRVNADGIVLPPGLTEVGPEAFSGCASAMEITLPESLSSFPEGVLSGAPPILWVHCAQSPLALELLNAGMDVDAQTVCRALVISQTYSGTELELAGPANDGAAYASCLASLDRLDYQVSRRTNLSADGIIDAIHSTFADASAYDISVLTYSGHGGTGGYLVGSDGSVLSPQALCSALDAIPGRKVLLIDACFSGGLLDQVQTQSIPSEPGKTDGQIAAEFNQSVLSAFSQSGGTKSRAADFGSYYIMTSARVTESCVEAAIPSGGQRKVLGLFSYYLCRGCGWDGVQGAPTALYADADADGVVSFGEAFTYAKRQARMLYSGQDAQSNVPGCGTFSPFR